MIRHTCLLLLLVTSLRQVWAADEHILPITPVSAADFAVTSPLIKPGVGALVLADIGESSLEYGENGWIVIHKRTRRIRILTKNGLEACTVTLRFSAESNSTQKLQSLNASTYNLVADTIEVNRLDPSQAFLEREKKSDEIVEKFTLPNAREGSIIEYSYTVRSGEIFQLHPWYFQCDYPVLKSQYAAVIPGFFNYAITVHGNLPMTSKTVTSEFKSIQSAAGLVNAEIYTIAWTMQDVDPNPEESYVFRPDAKISGLAFQLSAVPDAHNIPRNVLRSWADITGRLLQYDIFNETKGHDGKKLKQVADALTSGATSDKAKAEKIFSFVRDKINVTQISGWASAGPTSTLKKKSGNGGDKNLLLCTLLQLANIPASTVLVATRYKDPLYPTYPYPENANRMIVQVNLENKTCFLDCAHRHLRFGQLLPDYFNGYAIVVEPDAPVAYLDPDSVFETKTTRINAVLNDSGMVRADVEIQPGLYGSYEANEIMTDSISSKLYFTGIAKSLLLSGDVYGKIETICKSCDSCLRICYTATFEPTGGDLFYLNAMLSHNITQNPFIAAKRVSPIEMDYPLQENVEVDLEIPGSYQVESIPLPGTVMLNDGKGRFDYLIDRKGDHLFLRSHLSINQSRFDVADYDSIRSFYASVIAKQSQMIVLKKK